MKIPLFKPNLGEEELSSVKEVFDSGWLGLGPKTAQFEIAIAEYQGRKHAVAVNSCTAALHLALMALDLPVDAEVLVPTFTFVSTAHAVEYLGLKTVFVDCQNNLTIDLLDLERKISDKTKVIIPVHIGGEACQMEEIMSIAAKHNLIVIEDVANGQGSEYKGKKLGSWGHMACLSFEAKKNITTGDGGMILFDDDQWYEVIKRLRWLGISKDTWQRFADKGGNYSWYYEINELGYKYNMNDIAAAIGLCQLKKLDHFNDTKAKIIARYIEGLTGVGDIKIADYSLDKSGYWLFMIRTDHRDELFAYLASQEITCGVHFMPCHMHPYYSNKYGKLNLINSESLWQKNISLPLYTQFTESEQDYVISKIKEFYQGK